MSFPVTIEIVGVNGTVWTVYGEGAGSEGVYLLEDGIKGFMDAPVSVNYRSVTGRAGSSFLNKNYEARDLVLKFDVQSDDEFTFADIDNAFRQAFDYEKDTIINFISDYSGLRSLKVRLSEEPTQENALDPHIQKAWIVNYVVRAGDPFYYSSEYKYDWVFNGSNFWGDKIFVENPTELPVFPEYVLTAPARFILPDSSFKDDEHKEKMIFLPFQPIKRHIHIDTDPTKETMVATDATLVWAQMKGQEFLNPIPPRTNRIGLNVGVDPIPLLDFVFPSGWKIWIGMCLREYAEFIGLDKFMNITPEGLEDFIKKVILGVTPDWLEKLSPNIIAKFIPGLIADIIVNSYGSINNMAGSTCEIILKRPWTRPWGMERV